MSLRMNPPSWSIARKLLVLLLAIFVPALLVLVRSGFTHRGEAVRGVEYNARLLAESLAAQQEKIAIGTKQMLSTLALLPEVQRLDATACTELFRELHRRHPYYSIISASTLDGRVFASSIPFESGVSLSDRKHFREAIETHDFSAGEYGVGRVSKVPTLHFSFPVQDAEKNLVAVVSAGLTLDEYARYLQKANLPDGSAVVITDYKGVRLYRLPETDAASLGKPIPQDSLNEMLSENDSGTYDRVADDGINRFYTFKKLRLRDGSPPYMCIFVGTPKEKIVQEANNEMLADLSVLGMAAFAAVCLAWMIGNLAFVKPLDRLVEAVRRVGRGELGARTGLPHTEDELGQLARSFDEMAALLGVRDVERRQAETALRESEKKYRALFENMAEGVALNELVCNGRGEAKDYRVLSVNPAFETHLGVKREECGGRLGSQIFHQAEAPYLETYAQVAQTGGQCGFEAFFPPLGKYFQVSVTSPRPGQFVTVFDDITGRKRAEEALRESEERFRRAMEAVSDGLWDWNVASGAVYYSPGYFRMLGYDPSQWENTLQTWLDLIHPDDRERALADNEACIRNESPAVHCEFRMRARDGSWHWILGRGKAVLRDAAGRALHIIGTHVDITEQKRAQEEKERLEVKLRHVHKMEAVGTLAGGIAHDFNNILAAVIGYTEMALTDATLLGQTRRFLEEVLKAGRRAKELVKQILAFSRMQQRRERVPVRIAPLIGEALKLLRASLPATVEIRQKVESETGTALADATEIHQVLINLCTNAAQAMEEKGGLLEVGMDEAVVDAGPSGNYKGLEPGRYVRLTVSDTGHGMDPDILDRIFDPYFTTKEVGKGSGLGLAVVHGIVKRHRGVIDVSSKPGEGSTFTVYLPMLESLASEQPEGDRTEPIPRGRERILLVDDEESLAELGKKTLEYLGYRVVAKYNGFDALEAFKERPEQFDLVITDYTMPLMTGADLAEKLMQVRPDIPVILCTGYTERIEELKAGEMGIRAFVLKPLDQRSMGEVVRKTLDG